MALILMVRSPALLLRKFLFLLLLSILPSCRIKSFSGTISMEKFAPSKLSNLKELVAQLSLAVQIQTEVSSILEDYHNQLYSLEQDRDRLQATVRDQTAKIQSLEKRYSELLYKFSELKQ